MAIGTVMLMESTPASAAQSVPYRVNFQGRLTNASGNIVADGLYNMQFRLYDAASGGSVLWSETRETTNRVQVTNGLFSVQLGSVSALSPTLFNDATARHLEVTMATPATATCSTASCASWESPMTPRQPLASSTYALNSDLLDGQDGSYYQDASNLNTGTISSSRLTGSYTGVTGTGALSAGSIASGFGTIVTGNSIQGSRFTSTIATGTAPLTVTSTTKVSNLNVDLLDGLDSTAFAAASGSGSYIQNTTSAQTANFNITGNGTVGGNLIASGAGNPITISGSGISGDGYGITSTSDLSIGAANGIDVTSELRANSGLLAYSGSRKIFEANASSSNATFGQASATDTFTKLTDPASLPAGTSNRSAFSPDDQYMSVAHASSPYITIYKRSGDTFTKLANPASLPTGTGYGTAFSPDGQYMSVVHATSPYLTIYKRSGDTFTKLANPASLPTDIGVATTFSPDGTYLIATQNTSPNINIYKRSGDTFTKLANPSSLPANGANGVKFSPDGQYMSIVSSSSPYLVIYKRSGDTFVKLSDPATMPAGSSFDTAFSPDGQYMSVAHSASPYITVYKRSGDTFTKLSNPATLPGSTAQGVDFSADGQYMSVISDGGPSVLIYKRSGDTFTKLSDPAFLPTTGGAKDISFSQSGQYMSATYSNSPYITLYRAGSGNATNVTLNGALTSTGSIQGSKLDISGYSNLQGGANIVGALNIQGEGHILQNSSVSAGLLIQGKSGVASGDAPVFLVRDGSGNDILTVGHDVGNRVIIRGGSNSWGTGALEVTPAASNAYGVIVKANSGQTADLIRVVNSSNTAVFTVGSGGAVTANTITVPNYFQSTGSSGWLNATYGGGWYMEDSTWIRSYGSKPVYMYAGFDTWQPSGVGCGGGQGGGYTFQVCGSQRVTGGLVSDGTFTVGNANFVYGNPNGLTGIYQCKRTSDNIVANGASCTLSSSMRFKENVTSIDTAQALDILQKLRAVGFDWKDSVGQRAANGGRADYGVIAEEIEQFLPELVSKDADGKTLGVNYTGLIPFLIKAIQEQQSQIVQLQGGNPTYSSLAVYGPATVEKLTVLGDAHVKGDIYIDGHLVSGGKTPTIDTSLVTCLDNIAITGTDTAGTIRFSVNNTDCTTADLRVAFAKVYGAAPHATLTAKDRISARLKSSLDTDSQKMTFAFDELQAGKTYRFTYHVIQ